MGKLLSTIEINNKINAKLIKNPHLEYLGFENDKWIGANHTRLIIRCKIHNIICKPTFSNFIKKDRYLCSECVKEDVSKRLKITCDKAYDFVKKKYEALGLNYDLSKFKESFKDHDSPVTIICPIHGEFKISLRTLLSTKGKGICPSCVLDRLSFTEKQAIEKIQNTIKNLKKRKFDIKFLGFKDNKWVGNATKLILHCNIHNITWDTTNFNNFTDKEVIGCSKCLHNGITKEDECFDIIKKINPEVIRGSKLNVVDNSVVNRKYLFLDFIINDDIIIEYDGKQHYEFIESMQKTYSRFIDQVNRDNYLVQYCKDNNIRLLRISYKDNNRLEEVIKAFLINGIDISTKVEPKLLPVPITYYKSNYGR